MKLFIHDFVTKKMRRFRIAALLLLLPLLGAMLMASPMPSDRQTQAQGSANKPLAGFSAAIDPGHGGYDGGACARDSGIWEKVITLEIAKAIEQELTRQGARVVMTRTEDVDLSDHESGNHQKKRQDLQKRRSIAETAGADVLLSIHLNEYRDRRESGPQVFYQKGGDDGRLLAGVMQKALIDALKPHKERKAMAGDYYVLRGKLPSALIECGFISNAEEEKKLLDPAYQKKIARAVADGLSQYRLMLAAYDKKDEK